MYIDIYVLRFLFLFIHLFYFLYIIKFILISYMLHLYHKFFVIHESSLYDDKITPLKNIRNFTKFIWNLFKTIFQKKFRK